MTRIPGTLVLTTLLALPACGETGKLRLDGQMAGATPETGAASQGLTLGDGRLVIAGARIAVSEIELEGGGEGDELEAEMGSAVIDLKIDGTPTTVAVGEVDAGTYHTLGLEFTRRDLDGASSSLVVSGTYEGEPFVFRSSWAPEAEFPLSPDVTVPAGGEATAGVIFDVASWFTEADGSVANPADSAYQARIEQRLVDSISAAAEIEVGEDED